MRTVRDDEGTQYLLLKHSGDTSLVRDPNTGAEQYIENSRLEAAEGESPLITAASGIHPAVRRLLTATYDDRSLGLIVELTDRGPLSAIELLDSYDLCESDLHGLLGEFRAAGLVEEADAAGRRGYNATELATMAVKRLRRSSNTDS